MSVLPISYILESIGSSKFRSMARLFKLTRMVRLIKIVKERKNLANFLRKVISFSLTFEILFFFTLTFILLIHVFSCLWITVGKFN
jgi:hypothetical protein